MGHSLYQIGDLVYAAAAICNDGGMPGVEEDDGLIAAAGARGVIVDSGVTASDASQVIYLVRFESSNEGGGSELGDPVGCLPEELTQDRAVAA